MICGSIKERSEHHCTKPPYDAQNGAHIPLFARLEIAQIRYVHRTVFNRYSCFLRKLDLQTRPQDVIVKWIDSNTTLNAIHQDR